VAVVVAYVIDAIVAPGADVYPSKALVVLLYRIIPEVGSALRCAVVPLGRIISPVPENVASEATVSIPVSVVLPVVESVPVIAAFPEVSRLESSAAEAPVIVVDATV